MLTVISNSALSRLAAFSKRRTIPCLQDLKKVVGLLIGLREQTQGKCGNGIVTPGPEKSYEECLPILDQSGETSRRS